MITGTGDVFTGQRGLRYLYVSVPGENVVAANATDISYYTL